MRKIPRLNYTLIAEGYAEYSFIPTYLRLIALEHGIQSVPSSLGFKGRDAGKSKVLQEAARICTIAIQQDNQLVIIGIDLDSADHEQEQPKHTAECKVVVEAVGRAYKEYGLRIKHYVPVQAIEHWMAYQAYKVGLAAKFAENGVEGKEQNELKRLLYKGNNSGPNMDRVAKAIAEKADFDELAKQSRSFAHFHKQIVGFLENFAINPS